MKTLKLLGTLALFYSLSSFAQSPTSHQPNDIFKDRMKKENIIPNYYGVAFHKPNYFLPYYFTGSPDNIVYENQNVAPRGEQLKHGEVKYQISLKAPIWEHIMGHQTSLYLAYTQLSYWQLYNQKAFFRETDYEPEGFFAIPTTWRLSSTWNVDFMNVGYSHQSNGRGTDLQRGWDRIYVEAIAANQHWMLSLKPWIIVSKNNNNKNIGTYMGYAKFIASYRYHQQVISAEIYNLVESAARRPSAQLTWSFPLTKYFKGYVQVFSGYGQSLIEYNHHTNSAGIGLALNDWV